MSATFLNPTVFKLIDGRSDPKNRLAINSEFKALAPCAGTPRNDRI